jgi:hypothetical protein
MLEFLSVNPPAPSMLNPIFRQIVLHFIVWVVWQNYNGIEFCLGGSNHNRSVMCKDEELNASIILIFKMFN